MAEIGVEVIKAVAKHCFDLTKAAKQYPEDAARIHLRLAYVLSRVPEWSNHIIARVDDPGCILLVTNLHTALTRLTTCVEALGSNDEQNWRYKIKQYLNGKNLLTELQAAESMLNQSLLELNHDNTSFIAKHVVMLHENFSLISETEKPTLLVSACEDVDKIPSGNINNPKETLGDIINVELEECYENKDDSDSDSDSDSDTYLDKIKNRAKTDNTEDTDLMSDISEDDRSLLITNRNLIHFGETRIGVGGFAKVYPGKYKGIDVAIKVIDIYRNYDDPRLMPDKIYKAEMERVRDEAAIMKQCSIHTNIVDVYGYYRDEQKGPEPFIVMELMKSSLHKVIHERKSTCTIFSFSTRLKLMRDIASALEFLHLQRYIHQDVKPSNILVDERLTIAKLTDFGVTEQKGSNTTHSLRHSTVLNTILESAGKKVAGTRAYQAPELILGNVKEASREAEMYSFGVTIWECVSCKLPHHKKEDRIATLARHSTRSMLPFPLKQFLAYQNLPDLELYPFTLLEKVSYLCLSKYRPIRPNATQILQYFDGIRQFNPDFLMVAPLSKWSNKPILFDNAVNDSRIINQSSIEHSPATTKNAFNDHNANINTNHSVVMQLETNSVIQSDANNKDTDFGSNIENLIDKADITENVDTTERVDEESDQTNDNQNSVNSTQNNETQMKWTKRNWKCLLLLGMLAIVGGSAAILSSILQKPPNKPNKGMRGTSLIVLFVFCCAIFIFSKFSLCSLVLSSIIDAFYTVAGRYFLMTRDYPFC